MIYVICFIVALPFGIGLALNIMSNKLKANINGNSKSTLYDFSPKGIEGEKFKELMVVINTLEGVRSPVILKAQREGKKSLVRNQ